MGYRIGSYYIGSSEPQTSISNAEVIPSPPSNWTSGYNFVYFTFNNDADCTENYSDIIDISPIQYNKFNLPSPSLFNRG